MDGLFTAWGRILAGHAPNLSVEITRECPLTYPGCYAFTDDHLGPGVSLRQLNDFKGPELVSKFMRLVDEHKPVHVSIVGGEPLVRYRELNEILPQLPCSRISMRSLAVMLPTTCPWTTTERATTSAVTRPRGPIVSTC